MEFRDLRKFLFRNPLDILLYFLKLIDMNKLLKKCAKVLSRRREQNFEISGFFRSTAVFIQALTKHKRSVSDNNDLRKSLSLRLFLITCINRILKICIRSIVNVNLKPFDCCCSYTCKSTNRHQ